MVKVYKDHGISGAKVRNGRPQFDALCRDAAGRKFDLVMAWSRQRADDVEVRHWKELALACLHPLARLRAGTSDLLHGPGIDADPQRLA